jgi:beta-N-acetylhexosaminidase
LSVVVKSLPIRERLAQLFMIGFTEGGPGRDLQYLIGEHKFTSFIIFSDNTAGGAADLRETIAGARARAESLGLPPVLFAADEEGGLISPLGRLVGRLPSAMALAAGGSPPRARRAAALVGARLKGIGLDLVLAPVLDVNDRAENPVIGTRSFGDDPPAVAEMGAAVIAGFHEAGLACCAKHFPGHGSTGKDSHKALPVVDCDASVLEGKDLVPFRRAFELEVAAAMTAHVAYPGVVGPPPRPATVSRRIQTDLLRERMGFGGTLLSDALDMKGLSGEDGPEKACVAALKAGVDLLVCVDPDLALRCLREIRRAVEEGDVAPRTVDRALANVARLKRAACGASQAASEAQSPEVERGAARRPNEARSGETARPGDAPQWEREADDADSVIDECYAASITVVGCKPSDVRGFITSTRRGLFIAPEGLPGYGSTDLPAIQNELHARAMKDRWEVQSFPFDPSGEDLDRVLGNVARADGVVLCTLSRGPKPSGQASVTRAVCESRKPVLAAALLDPYGLSGLRGVGGIAVYGFWKEPMKALAEVLFAGGDAQGVLPIDI